MAGPERRTPHYADPQDVARVAQSQWTDGQIQCRDMGHHWAPMDAMHVARLRFYRVSHGCGRCGIVRVRELSERGHVFATTYTYPDGYLVQGLGRIAGDAKDAIRVAAIKRTAGVREIRGKAKDEDMPRFGATRRDVLDEGE